jgi:hypothetical protein
MIRHMKNINMETLKQFRLKNKLKSSAGKIMLFSCLYVFTFSGLKCDAQTIVSFEARMINRSVRFHWELSPNFIYQLLEVERSANHLNFSPCVSINGMSNKVIAWDKQPLQGKSYYRLKVTDLSGTVYYSDIIEVANIKNMPFDNNPNRMAAISDYSYDNAVQKGTCRVIINDLKGNNSEKDYQDVSEIPSMNSIRSSLPSGRPFLILVYIQDELAVKQIYFNQQ